jgi:nucleotide-binding universal stress UspA family protein
MKKGINTQINICHGAVVEEIIKVAENEKVDIIALASHGRTGLSRVFYGSVAAGILHRIDRPLLLVRSSGNQ